MALHCAKLTVKHSHTRSVPASISSDRKLTTMEAIYKQKVNYNQSACIESGVPFIPQTSDITCSL